MAEEEKKQETEETPEEAAEDSVAAETEAEQAEADPAAPASGEDRTTGRPAGSLGAEEAAGDEPAEALSPKARRKRERSRASGPARPPRTQEERIAERADRRHAAAVSRRRHRAAKRAKSGEPGEGTPSPDREPGSQKVRQGRVVSAGADKTITVEIPVVRRHPTYEKVVRRTSKLHAHDESNQAQEGDVVRVIESRPLSRTKRWRLLDVLERSR
jgi:small subunit ribosomal protein S17